MYVPRHFDSDDQQAILRLIRERSFATLITVSDGAPYASHCPLVWEAGQGANGTLYGHVARANPQWRHFAGGAEALAIFHGPHAYVSPSWYGQQPSVPTWNYQAVHAYGVPQVLTDAETRAVLDRLVSAYEAPDSDWSLGALSESYMNGMVRGIVAFALPIARLEAKFKLSQNRSDDDRRRVIARLDAMDGDDSRATAAAMKSMLENPQL